MGGHRKTEAKMKREDITSAEGAKDKNRKKKEEKEEKERVRSQMEGKMMGWLRGGAEKIRIGEGGERKREEEGGEEEGRGTGAGPGGSWERAARQPRRNR